MNSENRHRTVIKGQEHLLINVDLTSIFHFTYPIREITLLFVILTFLSGCARVEYNETELNISKAEEISKNIGLRTENIYIFTYNDDPLMRLDSYQCYKMVDSPFVGIDSRSGDKISMICANSHREKFHWQEIQSYGHLGKIIFNLEDENPHIPIATKEVRLEAGKVGIEPLTGLEPFLSEITIRSIKIDFRNESYRGRRMTGIKVYLTNVNAEISLLEDFSESPKRLINFRKLNEKEVRQCAFPSMLMRKVPDIEDGASVDADCSLNCFPNTCMEESLGSPFTRLVIEGKINGNTYWYPININRGTEKDRGVERNCRYTYDITIKKLGSDDPDKPVDFGVIDSKLIVEPWKEIEEYEVDF